jgi:hypothetical protein
MVWAETPSARQVVRSAEALACHERKASVKEGVEMMRETEQVSGSG